jgi:hypothetical protein
VGIRKRTSALVAKLLDNVIEQKQPPAQSSSVVYSAYSYFFAGRSAAGDADPLPVADRSLLLLLLLTTQSRQYRNAIAGLRDLHSKYNGGESLLFTLCYYLN